jgi:hypothetical protein
MNHVSVYAFVIACWYIVDLLMASPPPPTTWLGVRAVSDLCFAVTASHSTMFASRGIVDLPMASPAPPTSWLGLRCCQRHECAMHSFMVGFEYTNHWWHLNTPFRAANTWQKLFQV